MKKIFYTLLLLLICGFQANSAEPVNNEDTYQIMSVDRLPEANANYVKNMSHNRNYSEIRIKTALNPQPQILVICGTDPRVSPEVIFDAAPGEFCIIRTTGNIINDRIKEEINFDVINYNINNILVLGCKYDDFIKAYVSGSTSGPLAGELNPALGKYVSAKAKEEEKLAKTAEAARENLIIQSNKLLESGSVSSQIQRGQIQFMKMLYDPKTGVAEVVNE